MREKILKIVGKKKFLENVQIKILLEIKLLPEEQPYNVGTKRSVRVAPFLEMYYNQQLRK